MFHTRSLGYTAELPFTSNTTPVPANTASFNPQPFDLIHEEPHEGFSASPHGAPVADEDAFQK